MKALKSTAKQIAVQALGSTLATNRRIEQIKSAGRLTILNLHRIDDDKSSAYEALEPKAFDELVGWLRQHFAILTFGDLEQHSSRDKPPLILSFDDGYKDFIDKVAPILKKHGVRANQNIIPACVDSGKPPMNVMLQDFIGAAPAALLKEIELPGFPAGVDVGDRARAGIYSSAAIKNLPFALQQDVFAQLEEDFQKFDGFRTTPMMTVADITELAAEHEIGAHSFEHATMSAETSDYLALDIERCREWFASRLNAMPAIYAFPNGATAPGQAEMVREAGFLTVLLVGEQFSRHGNWLHYRFTMYGKSSAELRFRATGGFVKLS